MKRKTKLDPIVAARLSIADKVYIPKSARDRLGITGFKANREAGKLEAVYKKDNEKT